MEGHKPFESFSEFAENKSGVKESQKSTQEMADELKELGFNASSPNALIYDYFEAMGEDFERLSQPARELLSGLPLETAVSQVHNTLRITGRLAELEDERGRS